MRILALDTALGACSVAALEGGRLKARRYLDLSRGHAEVLMDLVSAVEDEAGFGALQCDRLAVTVGPGTFTGLRVGLAAARGLALASAKPLVGITTLQAIAAGAEGEGRSGQIICVLDARRGDVYLQAFAAGPDCQPVSLPAVLTHAQARAEIENALSRGEVHLIGTGAGLIAQGMQRAPKTAAGKDQPDAAVIARLAAALADPAEAPPKPLYLRAPDAKLPSRNPLTTGRPQSHQNKAHRQNAHRKPANRQPSS